MVHLRLNPLNRLAMCDEESAQITLSVIEFDEANIDWSAEYRIENNSLVKFVTPTPERTLDQARAEKRTEIEQAFTNAVNALPYTIAGKTVHYPMLPNSRTWSEAVALQAGLSGLPTTVTINQPFAGTDGIHVFATVADWRTFYAAMMSLYGQHGTNRAIKNSQIVLAQTIPMVDAITWSGV